VASWQDPLHFSLSRKIFFSSESARPEIQNLGPELYHFGGKIRVQKNLVFKKTQPGGFFGLFLDKQEKIGNTKTQ